jgi:hypothetical protein
MGNWCGPVRPGFGYAVAKTNGFKSKRSFWKKVLTQVQDFYFGSNWWMRKALVNLVCEVLGFAKPSCPPNGMDLDALYIRAPVTKIMAWWVRILLLDAP